MSLLAVVNAASAGGRTGRRWPEIAAALDGAGVEFEVAFTEGPGHATELVEKALAAGRTQVASCGGDGTLNEVVNGLIDQRGAPRAPGVRLALLPSGTGGDFRRTLGIPTEPRAAAGLVAAGATRRIDAGLIEYRDGTAPRRFVNIASCGVGHEVDRRVNELRFKPGKFAYALASGAATLRYRPVTAVLRVDGTELRGTFISIAFANAQYFGGGMRIAPQADPGDGLLDVILTSTPRLRALAGARHLYAGDHLEVPGSLMLRGREIEILPEAGARMGFDVDGEPLGFAPATVKVLPAALEIYCDSGAVAG
jgi:YegS/Rv2252/BmrU family lipid kinase